MMIHESSSSDDASVGGRLRPRWLRRRGRPTETPETATEDCDGCNRANHGRNDFSHGDDPHRKRSDGATKSIQRRKRRRTRRPSPSSSLALALVAVVVIIVSALLPFDADPNNLLPFASAAALPSASKKETTKAVVRNAAEEEVSSSTTTRTTGGKSKYAYVTLLYGDFHLGVRVMGRSILTHRKKRSAGPDDPSDHPDLVCLVTPDVSASTRRALSDDGWIVRDVPVTSNPNAGYASRLGKVYTKLSIYKLVEYEKVVFFDADAVPLRNVDELFGCDADFCAVMRHAELLNSGALVVSPNVDVYNDMERNFGTLYSYTGGDQGFLNSYFDPFVKCPYYEPNEHHDGDGGNGKKKKALSAPAVDAAAKLGDAAAAASGKPSCRRLPQRYNGDWPIAVLNGGLDCIRVNNPPMPTEFRATRRAVVLHYTFGSAKPWFWWCRAVVPLTHLWTDVAMSLKDGNGNGGGGGGYRWGEYGGPKDKATSLFLSLIPLGFAIWIGSSIAKRRRGGGGGGSCAAGGGGPRVFLRLASNSRFGAVFDSVPPVPPYVLNGALRALLCLPLPQRGRDPTSASSILLHIVAGLVSLLVGVVVGFSVVPTIMSPGPAWVLFLSYMLVSFGVCFGSYLCRWYLAGGSWPVEASSSSTAMSSLLPSSATEGDEKVVGGAANNNAVAVADVAPQRESVVCAAFVVVWVCGNVVRIHVARPESMAETIVLIASAVVPLVLALLAAFVRLPISWHGAGSRKR